MRTYIIRRILLLLPTVLLVTLIVFFIIRLIPGDIIDMMASQFASEEKIDRAAVEKLLGLDQPVIVQYGRWLGVVPGQDGRLSGVLQGNLGSSLWSVAPESKIYAFRPTLSVSEMILEKLPVTFELGLLGLIVSQLIAIPIGIYSAIRQDTWGDHIARSFAIFCIAVPGFWLGTLIVVFPAIWWGYSPPIMYVPFAEDPVGNLEMFIIPAVVLGMLLSGTTMRMVRTMMLEVLRQDYIRTAWAKGLRERVVIMRHALKNAVIPVVTIVGLQVPVMVGGTVIIEQIFVLPGMGRLLVDATFQRDLPIVSGVILVIALGIVLINLVVDLTYSFLDPRVRYR